LPAGKSEGADIYSKAMTTDGTRRRHLGDEDLADRPVARRLMPIIPPYVGLRNCAVLQQFRGRRAMDILSIIHEKLGARRPGSPSVR
jgi:hypothetical protein